ncbi:uncharacterized protein METZ01_LOCUS382971 [marine metagenome]|uniref:DUF6291 domain-containing protein n=1 Tax=marine metagenome TaxID=408172 RepID=A0A382U820_9ZZZZ
MDLKSERPSFLIYKADYDSIKNLSDQNLGKLFRAIFEYHNDKELKLEPEVQMALNFLKKQFQLDHIKWEKKVAAQRANGEKGGRPKSSDGIDSGEEKPNQTHGNFKNPTKPKKAEKGKEKGKEKEKEKEKVNIDIKMATPRKLAKNEINNIENKENLNKVWKTIFSDTWKQDSKIKEMYENKLSEFEN